MARYDRGFGGQGGQRPRGGDWGGYDDDYGAGPRGRGGTWGGGNRQGGWVAPGGHADFGHWNHYGGRGGFLGSYDNQDDYYRSAYGGVNYHVGEGGFGSGSYHGYGAGDYQARQGGFMHGGGQRRQGPGMMGGGLQRGGGAMYGGSLQGWGGGYDAYDRGIYGEDHPGPASWSGRGRTGYVGGGGRASQGRGYDRGWGGEGELARAPFMPEEAYRRHPEYDRPPHHVHWEGFQGDDEDLSDDEVRDFVRQRMGGDAWLDPDRIQVEVEDGVVTLTGEVDDFLEARYAWDDAWESPGVRGVVNNLTVRTDRPVETHGDVVPQSSGERPELEPGGATLWSEGGTHS